MFEYRAILVRVVDGDTVYLDLDLGFGMWRRNQSYRLARIDAPELGTDAGLTSKIALEDMLRDAALMAVTSKADKFGRFLADLYADGACVNDALVIGGAAVYRTY